MPTPHTHQEGGGVTYYQIRNGLFAKKANEGDPNAVERIITKGDRQGQKAWDTLWKDISGVIENVQCVFKETIKSEQLIITINEAGERYQIEIPLKGSYAENFIKRLPNVPKGADVILKPYSMDTDKVNPKGGFYKNDGIVIEFNGEKCPNAYTKDGKPNADWPKLPPYPDNERERATWKNYDMPAFYKAVVAAFGEIRQPQATKTPPTPTTQTQEGDFTETIDDLPF